MDKSGLGRRGKIGREDEGVLMKRRFGDVRLSFETRGRRINSSGVLYNISIECVFVLVTSLLGKSGANIT